MIKARALMNAITKDYKKLNFGKIAKFSKFSHIFLVLDLPLRPLYCWNFSCFGRKKTMLEFDYYCIIDFECTCITRESGGVWSDEKEDYVQEIIEFPVVLLHAKTLEIIGSFRRFVRPTITPLLSDFCTELTGITQDQVANEVELYEAMLLFDNWLHEHNLSSYQEPNGASWCFVTDGPFDLQNFLDIEWTRKYGWSWKSMDEIETIESQTTSKFHQMDWSRPHQELLQRIRQQKQSQNQQQSMQASSSLPFSLHTKPDYFNRWIDLRFLFAKHHKLLPARRNLPAMMEYLRLPMEGQLHSGIDDAHNMARVLLTVLHSIRFAQEGEALVLDENYFLSFQEKQLINESMDHCYNPKPPLDYRHRSDIKMGSYLFYCPFHFICTTDLTYLLTCSFRKEEVCHSNIFNSTSGRQQEFHQ